LVDYRAVNLKINKDNNRVPNIDSIWPHLRDMKFFTSLDLNSGYFQIPLNEKSKELTGINIDGIGYVFNSLPQGMNVSPSIFQTIMMDLFEGILWEKVIAYLDDICIFGKTLEECIDNTTEVLRRLNEKGFKLKTSKCFFFMDEVDMLGHKVSFNNLKPLTKHLDAIQKMQPPKTLKQLRSLIGTFNYHRKKVQNFSKTILPLTDILKGIDSKVNGKLKVWSAEHQNCFETIKEKLLSEPILAIYNPDAETYIEVDASAFAVG
uniref:RNA-directed DNA polymerase n=1 Tax=Brugia timori TaxID=42155 RepID=A0A0R3QJ32_9BILA